MGCPGQGILGQYLTFTVRTNDGNGEPIDATGSVTYSIYEDEGTTAIMSGTMTKAETGKYTEQISVSTANGFERYKSYNIDVTATVATRTIKKTYNFLCLGGSDIASAVSGSVAGAAEGSITKAEILTALNTKLRRNETNIDSDLRQVLKDISGRDGFDPLSATATGTIEAGDKYIDYPADFKREISIILNDGTYDGKPLTKIEWKEYLKKRAEETTSDRDEPIYYTKHMKRIYFYPVPDAEYTYTLEFYRNHPDDLDTILFAERFRKAIERGVIAENLEGRQRWDEAEKVRGLYESEIYKMQGQYDHPPDSMQCNYLGV